MAFLLSTKSRHRISSLQSRRESPSRRQTFSTSPATARCQISTTPSSLWKTSRPFWSVYRECSITMRKPSPLRSSRKSPTRQFPCSTMPPTKSILTRCFSSGYSRSMTAATRWDSLRCRNALWRNITEVLRNRALHSPPTKKPSL